MTTTPSPSQNGHAAKAVVEAPEIEAKKYKPYDLRTFRKIPQVEANLSPEQIHDIEVVSHVFPFKTNNYVVEELIDWNNFATDPMFVLNFLQKHMLKDEHFAKMDKCMRE